MSSSNLLLSKTNTSLIFEEIYNEEDADSVVYSIREEIIEKVMKQIDLLYFKEQLVNFLVDCSQDALKKLISIQFYHHNEPANLKKNWACEVPLPPCEPDTWTSKRVPLVSDKSSVVSLETKDSTSTEEFPECTCDIGVDCLCYKKQEERIQKALEQLYSKQSESTLQVTEIDRRSLKEYCGEYGEDNVEYLSEEPPPLECTMPGFTKILHKKPPPSAKMEISAPRQSVVSEESVLTELPPIRVDAKFWSRKDTKTISSEEKN